MGKMFQLLDVLRCKDRVALLTEGAAIKSMDAQVTARK